MLENSFEMANPENTVNNVPESDDSQPLLSNGENEVDLYVKTSFIKPPPKDRFLFVYLIFCFFGMTSLLPYNMFITDKEYFDYKFRNSTHLQETYESYFLIGTCIPTSVMLFVVVALKHKVSVNMRILGSLSGILLILIGVTSLVKVDSDQWTLGFFLVTIGFVIGLSVFGAIFQGSAAGLAGILHGDYMQGFMWGQAVAGVIAPLASIITMAVGSEVLQNALIYFIFATVVIFLTILLYLMLSILPFSKFYLKTREMDVVKKEMNKTKINGPPPYIYLLKKIWPHALSVALIYSVTLSLFPSTISYAESTSSNALWKHHYFIPVSCFLLFNVGDLIGRSLVKWIKWPRNSYLLLAFVLGRTVFFPLLLLCNIQPRPNYLPVIFNHDAWYITFNLLFGITNGYFTTFCTAVAPDLVEEEYRESVGSLMMFFISLGLDIGSVLSLAVNVFHYS